MMCRTIGCLVILTLGLLSMCSQGAEVTMQVLEAGAEPRQALRYQFTAGQTETAVLEMRMVVDTEVAPGRSLETRMPAIKLVRVLDSQSLSPDGDVRYEDKVVAVEVVSDPDIRPEQRTELQRELKGMEGLAGWVEMTPTGLIKRSGLRAPAGAGRRPQPYIDHLRQSVTQLAIPFPQAPIGTGARWEVTMPLDTPAFTLTQVTTYRLAESMGAQGKLDFTLTQEAPAQEMHPPGLPAGATATLEALHTSGTGTAAFDLTTPVSNAEVQTTTAMTVVMGAGSQRQRVQTILKLDWRMRRESR